MIVTTKRQRYAMQRGGFVSEHGSSFGTVSVGSLSESVSAAASANSSSARAARIDTKTEVTFVAIIKTFERMRTSAQLLMRSLRGVQLLRNQPQAATAAPVARAEKASNTLQIH